jgi:hypothetical protein
MAPQARLREAFVIRMDQEREIMSQVTRWLETSNPRKGTR